MGLDMHPLSARSQASKGLVDGQEPDDSQLRELWKTRETHNAPERYFGSCLPVSNALLGH